MPSGIGNSKAAERKQHCKKDLPSSVLLYPPEIPDWMEKQKKCHEHTQHNDERAFSK
jgi:hypothetical protein